MKRFPPKRILVPADLSVSSLTALAAAKALAKRWSSSLKLVHIEDMPVSSSLMPRMGSYWWPLADYHRWREEELKKRVADFPAPRLKILRIPGWPPDALVELARTRLADLMVMGTHGYAGLDRALFGSIAEAVVRRARVPVLVLHRRASPFQVKRILVPWNGHPYATAALRVAADWARDFDARLDILHVAPPWADEKSFGLKLRHRLESLLGRARVPCWELRLRRGDARDVVLREAAPGRFDLVVLSAHRRPVSADFVLGSTVERVLRHSRVPILAVPSTATRRPQAVPLPPEAWLKQGA